MASTAKLRLQSDFESLSTVQDAVLTIPDPNNIQHFFIRITPRSGIWEGGNFDFEFTIPDDYPFERPIAKCVTRIWHPNIEETGAICLSILREDYTPALDLSAIVTGLQFLFNEPNALDPLNKEAAEQFTNNQRQFEMKVKEYISLYCPK